MHCIKRKIVRCIRVYVWEKKVWKFIFSQGKVRENRQSPFEWPPCVCTYFIFFAFQVSPEISWKLEGRRCRWKEEQV